MSRSQPLAAGHIRKRPHMTPAGCHRGVEPLGLRMNTPIRSCIASLALAVLLSACIPSPRSEVDTASDEIAADAASSPQHAFLLRLRSLCGKAFAGRIVADRPASADDPFTGKPLVMHVRDCDDDTVRIPFHVGDDRSRTWVITLDERRHSLRLKHDHRHADGSADVLTWYGGDSAGTAAGQPGGQRFEFPADAESKALFLREDRAVSVPNVWALEIERPARRFVYELSRPGRLFRVEFDLTTPHPLPPAPWGAAP